ncbi:MAG: hypothetical protein H6Q06_683 [Acidobacteria bacterium]|nr:hypothetical protein [Acidobacteriota bacterium]
MDLRSKPRLGVMGSSTCSPRITELAVEVGRQIGRAGAILVCGGRGGVMEAAARGAKEAGGITIGILPGESDSEANPYIDIPIVTGMGQARNAINILTSQAVIAVAGAYGTLSEIALARVAGIPVIALESWSPTDPEGRIAPGITIATGPEEAVRLALLATRRASEF